MTLFTSEASVAVAVDCRSRSSNRPSGEASPIAQTPKVTRVRSYPVGNRPRFGKENSEHPAAVRVGQTFCGYWRASKVINAINGTDKTEL
ncbi:hypothetical protein [Microcoleus sp. herbarium12]|uniref:hypothetical protein n=1 Tax=Microcoleus sp. herbarium12 TaxID=3055437 RepID=UPI002FD2A04D